MPAGRVEGPLPAKTIASVPAMAETVPPGQLSVGNGVGGVFGATNNPVGNISVMLIAETAMSCGAVMVIRRRLACPGATMEGMNDLATVTGNCGALTTVKSVPVVMFEPFPTQTKAAVHAVISLAGITFS